MEDIEDITIADTDWTDGAAGVALPRWDAARLVTKLRAGERVSFSCGLAWRG